MDDRTFDIDGAKEAVVVDYYRTLLSEWKGLSFPQKLKFVKAHPLRLRLFYRKNGQWWVEAFDPWVQQVLTEHDIDFEIDRHWDNRHAMAMLTLLT